MSDVIISASADKESNEIREIKPSSWLTTIDFVKRLTFDNNILVAVLGEKGSGKTSFSKLLHDVLEPQLKSIVLKPGHLFNRAIFLQQMQDRLGVEGDLTIANCITKINEQHQHVLLVIDDAHYLSGVFVEEILAELHRQENTPYFHVCLISDFSLVTVLNRLARNTYKDMVHSIELGPLTEKETKQYVLLRNGLRQHIEKIVTDARVKQFYQLTAGHLVDINRQMTHFFSKKARRATQSDYLVRYLAIAAGFLIVSIGASYLWRSQDFQSIVTAWVNKSPAIQENASSLVAVSVIERQQNDTSDIPFYQVAASRQIMQATPLRRTDLVMLDEEDAGLNDTLPVMDKVIVAPKVVQHHVEEKVVDASINRPDTVTKKVGIQSAIEQNHYTIQILGGRNKEGLMRFTKKHGLTGMVQLCRTKHQGKDWYVITLGQYKNRQYATAAFKGLPKEVVQLRPWVRLIGDLKVVG